MVKRKSPVRHSVKSHTRKKKPVRSYTRGKGVKTKKITKRRVSKPTTGPKPFTVNFKYSEKPGDGESLIVIATSYKKAMAEAFEEKVDSREPIEIEIIDPDFGRVFRAIGSGLKRVVGVGAKYAIKGGHIAKQATERAAIAAKPHVVKGIKTGARYGAQYTKRGIKAGVKYGVKGIKVTGRAAASSLASVAHDAVAGKLVRDAYSPDRVKRAVARARLRKSFPDVWDVMDVSRT